MGKNLSKYVSVGVNYESCPANIRGRLAFGSEKILSALASLNQFPGVSESLIISTCNRTEIYCVIEHETQFDQWLCEYKHVDEGEIRPYITRLSGKECVEHLFRVTSGMDSMVLGETQILGQVKQAVRLAENAGVMGAHLRKLFDLSFSVAKDVRSKTQIGASSISIPAAAARISRKIYGSLDGINILLVGSGEMNTFCAEYFASQENSKLFFSNRTRAKAEELANQFCGESFPLTDMPARLHEFDVVISCTSSEFPIIETDVVKIALSLRKNRPMLIVDLAVPRDVEESVARIPDIFLYTLDDLGKIIQSGIDNRKAALDDAEKYIQAGVLSFNMILRKLEVAPVISEFRKYGERLADFEVQAAIDAIQKGADPTQVVRSLARSLTNKFMHGPSRTLNENATLDTVDLARALKKMFGLSIDE